MKLRLQGILLLAIPLLFEIIAVSVLLYTLNNFESAARSVSRAKQIVAQSDQIKITITSSHLALLSSQFVQRQNFGGIITKTRPDIQASFAQLIKLIGDDDTETKKLAENYRKDCMHVQDLLEDGSAAFERDFVNPSLAEFLNEKEYIEELSESLSRVIESARQLSDKFAPSAKEFAPLEEERRQQLKNLIIAALGGNVLIVLVLALFYSRNTMRRFDQLMRNIVSFATSKKDFEPLKGADELSELDRAFRESAEARYKAEDARSFMMDMVAHDLRTPLSGISLTLQLAQQGVYGETNAKLSSKIDGASSELDRLIRLVNDLLDVEKIQAGQFELSSDSVPLQEIFEFSISAVGELAKMSQIAVTADNAETMIVFCDKERIIQVMINLLSNAIRFSPLKSEIFLRHSIVSDNFCRIEVKDQGPGIPEAYLQTIFESFVQVPDKKNPTKGTTGLGLSICKALVEKHGGKIGVDSKEDQGSTFWFTIPIANKNQT